MKILSVNAGSSSLKFQMYEMPEEKVLISGVFERISTEEYVGEKIRKTFYIDKPKPEGNRLAIFSFGQDKVVINNGVLDGDKVIIEKAPLPFNFKKYYEEQDTEVKDFTYTPNLKRPITIIDLDTIEEVKPLLYFDETTNEVKGKCKLKAHKNYFAFEIRQGDDDDYILVGGSPVFKK